MKVCEFCNKTFLPREGQVLCDKCLKQEKGVVCKICNNRFLNKKNKKSIFCDKCIVFFKKYKEKIRKERRDSYFLKREEISRQTEDLIKSRQKTKSWISLRFKILSRDDFKCQYCGHGVEDGTKLVIDHKQPKSKGGNNEETNLITACVECNLGKGDILLSQRALEKSLINQRGQG